MRRALARPFQPLRRRNLRQGRRALDRLIEMDTVTNWPAEVKKWQAERARYNKGTVSKSGDKK